MSRNDNSVDELLAGARLGGAQYDEIHRHVLAEVAPAGRRWWPAFGGAAALASAFGAWLVITAGGISSVESAARPPASLSAKGESGTSVDVPGVVFGLECATPTGACRMGDTLMFSVGGVMASGYLGAYALRVGEPGSLPLVPERIWYFPSASGAAPQLPPRADTTVIREGVRLAAPHAPGRYEVTIWWSEVPPDRNTVAPPSRAKPARLAFEIVD